MQGDCGGGMVVEGGWCREMVVVEARGGDGGRGRRRMGGWQRSVGEILVDWESQKHTASSSFGCLVDWKRLGSPHSDPCIADGKFYLHAAIYTKLLF